MILAFFSPVPASRSHTRRLAYSCASRFMRPVRMRSRAHTIDSTTTSWPTGLMLAVLDVAAWNRPVVPCEPDCDSPKIPAVRYGFRTLWPLKGLISLLRATPYRQKTTPRSSALSPVSVCLVSARGRSVHRGEMRRRWSKGVRDYGLGAIFTSGAITVVFATLRMPGSWWYQDSVRRSKDRVQV